MGEVYLADHPRLPRRDALKILKADVSADDDFRQRFIREADLAAALWHPNIVGVHDRGEVEGQLWISMDYVEGTSTAQLLADRYPAGLPPGDVAEIVTAVAAALDYAHNRGLLHRDVKPANIMIAHPDDEAERRILLSDFGIARRLDDVSGLTATNMTIGTVAYSAPEQLMGLDMDGRTDQYALAATAYHLLTGSPLFPESNPAVVISRHLNTTPPALADTRPELAPLDAVLDAALAKDPADRFDRCTDFAHAFAEIARPGDRAAAAAAPTLSAPMARKQPAATAVPPVPAAANHGKRRWRPRTLLSAATAVGVLTAIGVVGYAMQKKHNTASPAAAGPVLDGTYRLVYNSTQRTSNGAPAPLPASDEDTTWSAFRSLCRPAGCVATGTGLDKKNPQAARTPAITSVFHFTDGQWQQTPIRKQVDMPECLGVDGKVVAGAATIAGELSLEPQPDGTLRGVHTATVLTNECGNQGQVLQQPVVATRTGDLPLDVTVADPTGANPTPPTSTTAPPAAGLLLDGTYRFELDLGGGTVNGAPANSDDIRVTKWWAFRSSCTTTRCVATGASLADNTLHAATGDGHLLTFMDGRWQDTPYLLAPQPCATGGSADDSTMSWSLQPQKDGTLRGVQTITVLSNECGFQGNVYKTPLVATRTGDVSPNIIVADPALFLS